MAERFRKFGVNGRTVLILLIASLIALAARSYVLVPAFRDQVGYIPFDLQPRLNRGMIVIQLGLGPARHLFDYLRFAFSDSVVTVVTMVFTIILWRWLFRVAPNRAFVLFQNGGIVFLPAIAAIAELLEHVAVYRVLGGSEREDYAAAIDLLATLHSVKSAALATRDLLTAGFVMIALVLLALSRMRAAR